LGRYLKSRCKLCRREGTKLMLKGDRCLSDKCAIVKKRPSPAGGAGGVKRRGKISEYAAQLREKQKIKRIYCLLEKQFRLTFEKAIRKKGITGEILLQNLETRLDSIVYYLNFASSRNMARQLISHGHITVNGIKVSIPSYTCKVGDKIAIKTKSKNIRPILESINNQSKAVVPAWLELDQEKLEGSVVSIPKRAEIPLPVNEQQVVELYSK